MQMCPEEFVKTVEDAYRSRNPTQVADLFTLDGRCYYIGYSPPDLGREAIREHSKRYFDMIRNTDLRFKLLASQGNMIVAESHETGIRTHNGKPFDIRGCAIWIVENEKIKEFRFYEVEVLFSSSSEAQKIKGSPVLSWNDADFWNDPKFHKNYPHANSLKGD